MKPGRILRTLKTLHHVIEYLAVICFYGVIRIVPLAFQPALAAMLGGIARLATPKRVRIAIENLKGVFPDYSQAQLRTIVKGVYRNLAANALDVVRPEQAVARVEVSPSSRTRMEQLRELTASGKSVIFASGHYGNWELLGQYLGKQFENVNFLAKAQSNRFVDRFINRIRVRSGGAIVPSHLAPRLLPKLLKRGESLLIVGDQDAGSEGTIVDFLGRPASYFRGMALFSYHYDVPMVVLFLKRTKNGFTLSIVDIVRPDTAADRDAEIMRLLTTYSDRLGECVRKNPDQWLWTHRRWKSTA